MLTVVIVVALLMALTALLLVAVLPGNQSSARQRELYEARAAGAGAVEYLYALLDGDPDFFAAMLAATSPATYRWIDLSSADAPDIAVDGDWNQFGADLAIGACTTRADPCWELRFAGDGTPSPEEVVVEAIVRFDCRSGSFCSTRRFQQQLRRLVADPPHDHEWTRSALTEVTASEAVRPGAGLPPPGKVANVRASDITVAGATLTWDVPSDGGSPTGYHVQWKSGSQDYPTDPAHGRHQETGSATYTLTGLKSGTTHTAHVRAVAGSREGEWSDDFDFDTMQALPNRPRDLHIDGIIISGGFNVMLDWVEPSGGGSVDSYLVQWKSGSEDYQTSGNRTLIATESMATVERLSAGEYMFRVRARNSAGLGDPSDELVHTLRQP